MFPSFDDLFAEYDAYVLRRDDYERYAASPPRGSVWSETVPTGTPTGHRHLYSARCQPVTSEEVEQPEQYAAAAAQPTTQHPVRAPGSSGEVCRQVKRSLEAEVASVVKRGSWDKLALAGGVALVTLLLGSGAVFLVMRKQAQLCDLATVADLVVVPVDVVAEGPVLNPHAASQVTGGQVTGKVGAAAQAPEAALCGALDPTTCSSTSCRPTYCISFPHPSYRPNKLVWA